MKAVKMISSMHHTDSIIEGDKKKTEIIDYYNSTKGGVDNMDKMVTHYNTTKRKTKRWPMAIFYNILDIAALAAFIIFKENNPEFSRNTDSRRHFLKDLRKALVQKNVEERSQQRRIMQQFSSRTGIECILGRTTLRAENEARHPPAEFAETCYICWSTKIYRKTRKMCTVCSQPVCLQHSSNVVKCNRCK